MKITYPDYQWNGGLGKRNGEPPYIVHHHEAGYGTALQIHHSHISQNGWRGIGYHYFIRRNGEVYAGRPEWAMGGHCKDNNDSIGICNEGRLHIERMTPTQKKATKQLVKSLHKKYPKAQDRRHSDLNATACPGKYYEWAYITRKRDTVAISDRGRLKVKLRDYARGAGIVVPDGFGWSLPTWGKPAKTLAWRVSGRIHKTNPNVKQSQWPTVELAAILGMSKYQ